MKNRLMQLVDQKYKRASSLDFEIGDTVVVTIKIIEGSKERLQDFEGTVIARRGAGLDEMFTVRKIVADEGVERTFPFHSPKVASIKVRRSGKIRRAKLYYLRDRLGKARKLKARHVTAAQKEAAANARSARREAERVAAEVAAGAPALAGAR